MENKNNWKAWLYLSPALILMSLFTFFPLINTFVVSFMTSYKDYSRGKGTGFTFSNYGVVLGFVERNKGSGVFDKTFFSWNSPSALTNTLLITIVTVPLSVIIALLIAICLNNIKPLKKFFQIIFFMPYVTNVIAVGMVFAVMFQRGGVINSIFNITKDWIGDKNSTWGSCMFVLCLYIIWNALPYKILIFMSGLQGIDKQYYEAARIDSAPRWKIETKITLPLLSPQILYITVTSFIGAFKEYNSVIGLLNRNYSSSANVPDMYTVVYYIYDKLGKADQTQYASAAAVILFILIMIITFVQMKVSEKKVVY